MSAADFTACVYGPHERRGFAIDHTVVERTPFCALTRFADGGATPVLLVAPLSGQHTTPLEDMVEGLLPEHDVYVTAWADARDVPLAAGPFGLDDNIAVVADCIRRLGPDVHVVAVCQSAVPALAATALLAADGDVQPRSLVLMGGLIDTRLGETRVGRVARSLSLAWLERAVIARVTPAFPGHGRRVYPAWAQRAALRAYLARHLEVGAAPGREVGLRGDAALGDPRVCRALMTLMDVPAELFLDNIAAVFQDCALPRGTLRWRDRPVEPAAITATGLMTIEGAFDDISGRGQTHAAHDLCRQVPAARRCRHDQAGVGHFGLYAGAVWRRDVLPRARFHPRPGVTPGRLAPPRQTP